jgi:hypothetical protein
MTHWKSKFAGDIFDFDYDALVSDPQPALQRLYAFLGLEWAGDVPQTTTAVGVVKTASAWQVREPLYRGSSGRARHYVAELKELRDSLADFLPA